MQSHQAHNHPIGLDLPTAAGLIQALAALALLFLPLAETCIELPTYPPLSVGCTRHALIQEFELIMNGPVIGLAMLLAAGILLNSGGRIQSPHLLASSRWLAVAMNVAGVILAWPFFLWFLPTTICAIWAALPLRRISAGRPLRQRYSITQRN